MPDVAPQKRLPRRYDVSELILKNGDTGGCWMALDGDVYDLTTFLHLHPGGAHVLRLYAGMDGTRAFGRVHRGAGPPAALRERYRLGRLRVLTLDGCTAHLYRRWRDFAYLVVEMQNALRLDISLQSAVTARHEASGHRSRYELQRAVETHARFVGGYLAACTGTLVQELWLETETLCLGQTTEFFRAALAAAASDEHRVALARAMSRLKEAIAPGAGDGDRAPLQLLAACHALERLAEKTIADVKSIFQRGLQAFEYHEFRLLARGGALLPSLLARLPRVIAAYYDEVVASMPE